MSKRDYVAQFWDEFDKVDGNPVAVEKAVVSKIDPLTIVLRGIEYDDIFISEHLIAHDELVDVVLSDKILHDDKKHKDLIGATLKHEDALEVGDVVVVFQSNDRQSLTVLAKVVRP